MRGLTRKLSSAAVVAAIAVAAVSGLSGCEKEGGIAAAVNSDKVYEQQVTDYVENFRANQELTDATTWAKYLQQNGYTPESLARKHAVCHKLTITPKDPKNFLLDRIVIVEN